MTVLPSARVNSLEQARRPPETLPKYCLVMPVTPQGPPPGDLIAGACGAKRNPAKRVFDSVCREPAGSQRWPPDPNRGVDTQCLKALVDAGYLRIIIKIRLQK